MHVLDLDLDFFLNKNAYGAGHYHGRLGPEYRPWQAFRVRQFLERRCNIKPGAALPGFTVRNHNEVLGVWSRLIKSGKLVTPFDVIHIDAHPDFWVGWGLNLAYGYLRLQPERELEAFNARPVHEGNFLTLAIARGWVKSLVWVPLMKTGAGHADWDADARTVKKHIYKRSRNGGPAGNDIPYSVVPWNKFHAAAKFDFMDLSRSPGFTPPASDTLVAVIESYMKQI